MKKTLFLFLAMFLIFTSCEKEDDSPQLSEIITEDGEWISPTVSIAQNIGKADNPIYDCSLIIRFDTAGKYTIML